MKTLREMMDLIVETEQAKYPVKLDDVFGGGILDRTDSKGTFTATYKNKKGEDLIKLVVNPKESKLITSDHPRGDIKSGFSLAELNKIFMDMVIDDMLAHYERISLERDPNRGTLSDMKDLLKRMNMKESRTINEDVRQAAMAQVKSFFDDLNIIAARVEREIAEINGNLQEDTSVNMSPYKDSIQNAETPKQKAAKNKISDLTRK